MIFIQENDDFFDKTSDIVLDILDKLANPFLNQYVHVFLPDKRSCQILKNYITEKRHGSALILPKILSPTYNLSTEDKLDCIQKTIFCLPSECQNFDYAMQLFNEYRHIINEQISLQTVEHYLINKDMIKILQDMSNILPPDIFFKDLIQYAEYVKNTEIPCIIAGFHRSNKYIENFLKSAYKNEKNKLIFYNSADIYNFQKQLIENISSKQFCKKATTHVAKTHITNLPGIYEEIKLISTIIRQNIGKRILLIYTDKSIARGVQLYLKKWNIILDIAVCKSLKETKNGIIISLILKIFQDGFKLKSVVMLINFVTNGESCKLEKDIFLSTKTAYDVTDFAKFDLINAGNLGKKIIQHLIHVFKIYTRTDEDVSAKFAIFEQVVRNILIDIDAKNALDNFWESVHKFSCNSINEYFVLIDKLLAIHTIKFDEDKTPNILALTPQESLLIKADITIICGFNESNWSINTSSFLFNKNTNMANSLDNLENDIIYNSINHVLKSSQEVHITNSDQAGFCQKISLFLQKEDIQTAVERGNNLIFESKNIYQKSEKPSPVPPLYARPLTYSATDIEQLANNPYAFYSRKILKLRPISYIFDTDYENRLKGTILHEALKLANNKNKDVMRNNIEQNINLIMAHYKLDKFYFLDWFFRIPRIAKFASENIEYGKYLEYNGSTTFCLLDNYSVKIKCIADCIQNSGDSITIVDYKTGTLPSMQQIISLEKPQLIVEGVIAQNAGFYGLEGLKVQDLKFIRLGSSEKSMNTLSVSDKMKSVDMELLLKDGEIRLIELLKKYTIQVNSFQAVSGKFYDEYGHLARGKEWGTYA